MRGWEAVQRSSTSWFRIAELEPRGPRGRSNNGHNRRTTFSDSAHRPYCGMRHCACRHHRTNDRSTIAPYPSPSILRPVALTPCSPLPSRWPSPAPSLPDRPLPRRTRRTHPTRASRKRSPRNRSASRPPRAARRLADGKTAPSWPRVMPGSGSPTVPTATTPGPATPALCCRSGSHAPAPRPPMAGRMIRPAPPERQETPRHDNTNRPTIGHDARHDAGDANDDPHD